MPGNGFHGFILNLIPIFHNNEISSHANDLYLAACSLWKAGLKNVTKVTFFLGFIVNNIGKGLFIERV